MERGPLSGTRIKRTVADIPWSDPPLAEQSVTFDRLKAEALAAEARGENETSFKPEEWGL